MTGNEIYEKLQAAFGKTIGGYVEQTASEYQRRMSSYAEVTDPGYVRDVCLYLRDEADLAFDNLNSLSTDDNGDKTLSVTYHMESMSKRHHFALKVTVPID